MKTILSDRYEDLRNIKTFNGKNYDEITNSFKSLPKQRYEMEMFELTDNTGIALSFDDDLHIKIANEDRDKFEKYFNIKTSDHIMVDFGETEKFANSKGPRMKKLKKNRRTLTDEERKEVMSAGAVWDDDPSGKPTPGVWKAVVDGKDWYVCNTHRAYQCKPTLKGAIKAFDFIKTTA